MGWLGSNFGSALKAIARTVEPDRPALVHGDDVISWADFDRITDNIAAGLRETGLKPGDVAGQQLRNSPAYMFAWFGCAKAGVIPVNINYHYKAGELGDIFARFGLKALFVEEEFAQVAAAACDGAPDLTHRIVIGGSAWAKLCDTPAPPDFAPSDDSDGLFYVATGGTTGMPKAVMWPFGEAWQAFQISSWMRALGEPPWIAETLEDHAAEAACHPPPSDAMRSPSLCLSPLMHGAGQFASLIALMRGGTLITIPATGFDSGQVIDTVRDRGAKSMAFVGDAFALPLADALEARADAAEAFASMRMITSSGAIFSAAVKERLLAINPQMIIVDALGSSESAGTAVTITTAAGSTGGGHFSAVPGRETAIFDADFNELPAGSEEYGTLARSGPLPLGYLGEDEKNAETFPVISGKRWLMTGDMARFREDGSIEFKGRDNMCINTGGEKVFPEEVEGALQSHPAVDDVRVVGVPDPRFGRKIAAVVQLRDRPADLEAALDSHVRERLAGYKVPRLYVFTGESLRLNNGKPDYRTAQSLAEAEA
ncbi:AMP-binding protein [Parasphingopyxis algicola]|uniref:AMP-binding protein n=1 Tax=Parasphingopyxis algicola TaxID=2026624 RepID=UPI0015A10D93|nr:AMP-binding protein [Parasphingopyxis algicola]QLC25413.1 AMP-binding protein [Parasphingopyxis algicola]